MRIGKLPLKFVAPRAYENAVSNYDQVKDYVNSRIERTLESEFKLSLGENHEVPMGKGDVPRILIVNRDQKGAVSLKNPNDIGILPGSEAFTREILKGNVLVFPAGKENPVQLNVDIDDKKKIQFTCSEELNEERSLPQPPKKKMGFWRGLARVVTFGLAYRGRVRENRQMDAEHKKLTGLVKDYRMKRTKELMNEELKEAEKQISERKAALEKAEKAKQLQKSVNSLEAGANARKQGDKMFLDIFRPNPVIHDNLIIKEGLSSTGNDGYQRIYTEDQFKDMTVFTENAEELDAQQKKEIAAMNPEEQQKFKPRNYVKFEQSKIKLGPDKKPLTDEEFAGLSMLSCYQPELQVKMYEKTTNYDPTLAGALEQSGFKKEDIPSLISYEARSMATTDMFMTKGRANEGKSFKDYSNQGRIQTAKAFQQYAAGNKEPLAKLVANAITECVKDANMAQGNSLAYNMHGVIYCGKQVLSLMDKDPTLKTLAMEKFKLDDRDVKTCRGLVEIDKLEQEGREASRDLGKNALTNKQPDGPENQKLAQKIIASRLAMDRLSEHNRKTMEEASSVLNSHLQIQYTEQIDKMPREQWPALKPGHIHNISLTTLQSGIMANYGKRPAIALDLAKQGGVDAINKMAMEIVQQEGLANMDAKSLHEHLNGKKFSLTDAIKRHQQAKVGKAAEQNKPGIEIRDPQKKVENKPIENQQFKGIS